MKCHSLCLRIAGGQVLKAFRVTSDLCKYHVPEESVDRVLQQVHEDFSAGFFIHSRTYEAPIIVLNVEFLQRFAFKRWFFTSCRWTSVRV